VKQEGRKNRKAERGAAVRRAVVATAVAVAVLVPGAAGQTGDSRTAPTTAPATAGGVVATQPAKPRIDLSFAGMNVEQVRVVGNTQTSAAVILNAVRTREGEPFDPLTVEEDYQRIFRLRRFSNVEARIEPTAAGGVVVVFTVVEQRTVSSLAFLGNAAVPTPQLRDVVDVREGESIDRFRIALARQNIERLYKDKNFPFASVEVEEEKLTSTGELVFVIVEGPNVRVRKVAFPGNQSFERGTLLKQVRTQSWIFVFRNGRLDFEQLEDDVGALRRFYESKGFFDVRVGRRVRFSPDLSQAQVDFVIDEGKRYVVEKITFDGLKSIDEAKLRESFRLKEGDYYDKEVEQRDVRQIVRAYSPLGFIYVQQSSDTPDPNYLRINPQTIFEREPGKTELVYRISEGKPFRMGRVLVKGNSQSMDKLVLREMRVQPGEMYNSAELTDATDRIRATPYFQNATITPVGDDPNYRDVLVEVQERQFRSFNIGAGVNSNGGVGGNLTFEHRNFDIGQVPARLGDTLTDRAFTGAGQRFRISLEPGTEFSSASILFSEPSLWDSPYSFTSELYLRDRIRSEWRETRAGGRLTLGRKLGFLNQISGTVRIEDVEVWDIDDTPLRAPEVLDEKGHNLISTYTLAFTRDTTNRGFLPYQGYTMRIAVEQAAQPGKYTFTKVSGSWDQYFTLREDLLDRKTVLALHADAGNIFGDAPFFEQFYAGGIGSIRGFRFRGVSPRSGLDDDAIGGSFAMTVSGEVSYPLAGEFLRGVVFVDTGTVESDVKLGTYRVAAGHGFRLYLPFFGSAPFALDFATPLSKDSEDETQIISFSFGFNP
jgi:outer membrane protein insertion porin family